MVNIVIENLLSTASNRALYQALWSLSLSKSCKPENVKTCENFSIAAICNELIQEIRRDDPDPNKFYFSSQLAFGVVQLYRYQINKLLTQVKHALQSCQATFFEIDWLSRLSETQNIEASQISNIIPIRKKGAAAQERKTKKPEAQLLPLSKEIELIEKAFTIPDDEETQDAKKKGKKTASNSIDVTMATSAREITIIEKFTPKPIDNFRDFIGDEFDEFGGDLQQEFFSLPTLIQRSSVVNENEQEVPELAPLEEEIPDVFRSAENPRPASPGYELAEATLSNDIMEIVNKHKTPRKRRSSEALDISDRIGRAAKASRLSTDDIAPEVELGQHQHNISSFDHNANAIETVGDAEFEPEIAVQGNLHDVSDVLDVPPTTPPKTEPQSARKIRKPKQKKRKLIIDTITVISDAEVEQNRNETIVEPLPIDTFMERMAVIKYSDSTFWETPATRLKFCGAKKLLPLFTRNLKVVKQSRQAVNPPPDEASPPKKRKLRERSTAEQKTDEIDGIVAELPLVEVDHPQILELDIEMAVPTFELPPPTSIKKKSSSKKKKERDYQENEKWSKHKIVKSLNEFWDEGDEAVTMPKLCAKTNRFVAAGVFFELMVLSKEGAVELTQGEGLQIANITAGRNVEIYM